MTPSIPIFRNEINALEDFRGGVKVARDFAPMGWLRSTGPHFGGGGVVLFGSLMSLLQSPRVG